MTTITQLEAEARRIRRSDYVSCTVAFIDCKKPGSHLKENYSIIGPGVTSSEDQVVNLPEAHGFNIGAAAMPNGITNNLHIHFTAEVFIVQKGEWTFRWGSNGENEIVGREGDIVSVPTWIFRGFTNTGPDDGWLFTALGGDNTGGVIFHPEIIREAANYGLYISSENTLIDTSKGDPVPSADQCIPAMPDEEVAVLKEVAPDVMRQRVVTEGERDFRPAFIDRDLPGGGAEIAPDLSARSGSDASDARACPCSRRPSPGRAAQRAARQRSGLDQAGFSYPSGPASQADRAWSYSGGSGNALWQSRQSGHWRRIRTPGGCRGVRRADLLGIDRTGTLAIDAPSYIARVRHWR